MTARSADAPFPPGEARTIARAFLPPRFFGNRYDYFYTLSKLRTDPLYPGVLDALRGSTAPVLDLGCGLGLLATRGHALRRPRVAHRRAHAMLRRRHAASVPAGPQAQRAPRDTRHQQQPQRDPAEGLADAARLRQ